MISFLPLAPGDSGSLQRQQDSQSTQSTQFPQFTALPSVVAGQQPARMLPPSPLGETLQDQPVPCLLPAVTVSPAIYVKGAADGRSRKAQY